MAAPRESSPYHTDEQPILLRTGGSPSWSLESLELPGLSPPPPKANWYAKFVVRFPYIMPLLVLVVVAAVTTPALKLRPLPDFDDPTAGFDARKTDIRARSTTLSLLSRAENKPDNPDGVFFTHPNQTLLEETLDITQCLGSLWESGHTSLRRHARSTWNHPKLPEDFQCTRIITDRDTEHWIKFVFESKNKQSLFTVDALHAMCELEERLVKPYARNQGTYCPMYSLPFYMSVLYGKSCKDITEADVTNMRELLTKCAPYYRRGELSGLSCTSGECPPQCTSHRAVYSILHYLSDYRFFAANSSQPDFLTYALFLFRDDLGSDDNMQMYKDIFKQHSPQTDLVKISGMYGTYHLKYDLFNDYLMSDIRYLGLAMGLILIILLLYLRSPVLMLATLLNVAFSFALAYGFYIFVLQVTLFPFLNILAGLILIAIGADDVFIFHDALEQAKREHPGASLDVLMTKTFNHAILSIFVTSLTTSAAFFANYVSHIATVRCFGLFAGSAVLANFLLMVTWTPSIVAATERVFNCCCPNPACFNKLSDTLAKIPEFLYGKVISPMVTKAWALWVVLLLALGVGSLVVVFYKPGLRLPVSKEMPLFPNSHPMENWDQNLKFQFQFVLDQQKSNQREIILHFVWGVHDEDNGKWYDPNDDGHLHRVSTFNPTTSEAQLWIVKFCKHLRNQNFIDETFNQTKCSLERFGQATSMCALVTPEKCPGLGHCCEALNQGLPYSTSAMETCLPALSYFFDTTGQSSIDRYIYNSENKAVAYHITAASNRHFSTSYALMNEFYEELTAFMNDELSSAPTEMKQGWFSGYSFRWYDLQRAISHGTPRSIALSLGVATLVMLLTSLNLLLTLYAMLTITLAIAATVASIVLLGWHLNIIESMTISLAVGLSIDFTIHYGVAYRLSPAYSPIERVHEAFLRVGSPVAMAALTTFVAGAAMMPSSILAYTKLGIFLMLVMTFSWVYATFFFQALCRIIGPWGNFCQVPTSCKKKPARSDMNGGRLALDLDQHSLDSVNSQDSILISA